MWGVFTVRPSATMDTAPLKEHELKENISWEQRNMSDVLKWHSWKTRANNRAYKRKDVVRDLICSFGNNGKSLPWKFAGSLAVLVVKVHPETRRQTHLKPLYMGSLCNRTTALYKSWWTWTEKLINSKQSIEYICAKLNYTTFALKSHRCAIMQGCGTLLHSFWTCCNLHKYWTDIFDLLSKVYKKILFQIQWLSFWGDFCTFC